MLSDPTSSPETHIQVALQHFDRCNSGDVQELKLTQVRANQSVCPQFPDVAWLNDGLVIRLSTTLGTS